MKTVLTIMALIGLASCKTSHFKGSMAVTEVPSTAAVPGQAPDIMLPVETETSVLQGHDKEPLTKTDPPRILTLSVSKLKHDSLYKNCLSVLVDGQSHAIACNKDFTAVPPKVIALPNSRSCQAIGILLESVRPVDQNDCIQKIQANRQQHSCEYQKEAFRTSRVPDPLRFKTTVTQLENDLVKRLEIAFEDSQDADYNDYTFSITADEGSYLVNRDKGLEYCFR